MRSVKLEFGVTCVAAAFAVGASAMTLLGLGHRVLSLAPSRPLLALEAGVFAVIVALLAYGGLVYQLARAGYFFRLTRRAACSAPESFDEPTAVKPLAVLIPSYREELKVLRQTVLSAALMEHPNRRVVVLLDDPPSGNAAEMLALGNARRMVRDLDNQFTGFAGTFRAAEAQFRSRRRLAPVKPAVEAARLQSLHLRAADWLQQRASAWVGDGEPDPADRFFSERIMARLIGEHRSAAQHFAGTAPGLPAVDAEYRKLALRYDVRISLFERKRYVNLSHAPNKAMNLTAYIGLLDGAYRVAPRREGLFIEPGPHEEADIVAPTADYLLTLDADSLVLPDYATKLVAVMERDARVAVAQTPYSAFPGAPGALERIAGATTDLQHITHQGTSAFAAEYWVGANALLRRDALLDIQSETIERGHRIPVFIQDRTVIEDTGSTVDLITRGWRLHNHPERLAYSATPPDFGSLTIQRRRWANGGLIILPDLLRYLSRRAPRWRALLEGPMRAHYLVSPAISNFGLLALLVVPFDPKLASIWLPLTAAPYYGLYARDLQQNGYRWIDLFSVYALNLMLLPVNLAGVVDSIRQLITRRKSPFVRTPKIEGRTSTPRSMLLLQAASIAYLLAMFVADSLSARWEHAIFSGLNLGFFAYGFIRFVGVREAVADLAAAAAPPARRIALDIPLATPAPPHALTARVRAPDQARRGTLREPVEV